MDHAYLVQFRDTALSIDRHLKRSFREATSPGGGPELDAILAELLPYPDGRYVDIGAHDPIQLSNTWPFYQRGWTGLLIEPDSACHYRLLRHRPRDFLWPTAVGSREGTAILRADGSGVSSLDPTWPCPENARTELVEVFRTSEVLQIFSAVRNNCTLCSLDVEGLEGDVLQSIDFTTFRPQVFVVESLRYDPVRSHEPLWESWEPLLLAQGYELFATTHDGLNRVYRLISVAGDPPADPVDLVS